MQSDIALVNKLIFRKDNFSKRGRRERISKFQFRISCFMTSRKIFLSYSRKLSNKSKGIRRANKMQINMNLKVNFM